MTKAGTFKICGNRSLGYWLQDTDNFNDWGVLGDPEAPDKLSNNFKTRDAAERYGWRCHEFKIGRRMTV
jgi:hypothetical protein